jgi:hypothetical protein
MEGFSLMTPKLKEKLLKRLFSSIEYIEKFCNHFDKWMEAAICGFEAFEKKLFVNSSLVSKHKSSIGQWQHRVIPNFKGMRKGMFESLEKARNGDFRAIRSDTANLNSLSKDMDGIGWDWWKEIDSNYWDVYVEHSNIAEQMASNIYYTLAMFWDTGEILDEEITGKIDEKELLEYLKPGEQT